jgi:hypothetical protein
MTEQVRSASPAVWIAPLTALTGGLGLWAALEGLRWWQSADWTQLPVSLLMWASLLLLGLALGGSTGGRVLRAQALRALPVAMAGYLALVFCLYLFNQHPSLWSTGLLAVSAAALVMFARDQRRTTSHHEFNRQ